MDERDRIIEELLKREIVIEPDVLPYIIERGGVNYVSDFANRYGSLGYVTVKDINNTTKSEKKAENKIGGKASASEYDWNYEILLTANVHMEATGSAEDFHNLFLDRFEKLHSILKHRRALVNARRISKLSDGYVATIGMVNDVRRTSSGRTIFEIEDPTGTLTCMIRGNVFLLKDEVIGVRGKYNSSKRIMYLDKEEDIIRPDVRWVREKRKINENLSVAIISDTHVGSKTFIRERWEKFLNWLKSGEDEAGTVKYLIIAGDLVDGIGVYPNQEEELEITDIFKQYEVFAEYLKEVPDYVKVMAIPGNHDIVRNAEPQPALPKEIRDMFDSNVVFLSNPAMVSIHGYKFTIYHGASLNNLVELIPGMDYQKTDKIMEYMLKFRHLSPVYGEKVPIVPYDRDYLVMDPQPDVLVTGHVHAFSYGIYKGIHMVNASTWQKQTKYQKMMNFNPDPGKVAILNMNRDEMIVKSF